MTVDQLKHLIAEAARITGEEYIYVIGSNALLGTVADPRHEVFTRSRESDIIPGGNDPKKADQIDFMLGELSEFDNRNHYYAQGLTLETPAYAPRGWETRTVRLPVSRDVTGLCPACALKSTISHFPSTAPAVKRTRNSPVPSRRKVM